MRLLVMPVSAILGILSTRLIIQNFGQASYAQYGLLVSIVGLLPFADLGMSAAIMNATGGSADPAHDDHLRRMLVTSIRVLILAAGGLVAAAVAISALGLWPALLGDGLVPGSGPIAAALCLALIGLGLPVAFGQRVLTGLGRNHVTIALMGIQTPVVLGVLLLIVHSGGSGAYIAVVPYVVTALLSLTATVVAARLIRPTIGRALRGVPRLRRVRGARVVDVAWPMLVIMTVLPAVNQSDRIVLSHLSNAGQLATYNLASQMYWPVWQLTTAGGIALWPVFARARARGERAAQSPVPLAAGFAGAAAVVCLAITVLSPWLARLASGGEITVPPSLLAAFSALMIAQAATYPFGMFMTDPPGLRFQALMALAMMPVNLGLSLVLAARFGAVGPVVGSAVGVFGFQVVANAVYARRVLGRGP